MQCHLKWLLLFSAVQASITGLLFKPLLLALMSLPQSPNRQIDFIACFSIHVNICFDLLIMSVQA